MSEDTNRYRVVIQKLRATVQCPVLRIEVHSEGRWRGFVGFQQLFHISRQIVTRHVVIDQGKTGG